MRCANSSLPDRFHQTWPWLINSIPPFLVLFFFQGKKVSWLLSCSAGPRTLTSDSLRAPCACYRQWQWRKATTTHYKQQDKRRPFYGFTPTEPESLVLWEVPCEAVNIFSGLWRRAQVEKEPKTIGRNDAIPPSLPSRMNLEVALQSCCFSRSVKKATRPIAIKPQTVAQNEHQMASCREQKLLLAWHSVLAAGFPGATWHGNQTNR